MKASKAEDYNTPKERRFWTIQRRIMSLILVAFIVPYISMLLFANVLGSELSDILSKTKDSFNQTNESLRTSVTTHEQLFKLSALDKAEDLASRAAFIIQMRSLIETQIPEDRDILELIQSENVGEESQISIINPLLDKIIADKYFDSGSSLATKMPLVMRLINEKNYLKILSEMDGAPSLAGDVASIGDQYEVKVENEDEGKGGTVETIQMRFVVLTPIKGTPYSLAVVASMGGVTKTLLTRVNGSLFDIGETLREIDSQTKYVLMISSFIIIAGALFGIIFLGLVYILIHRQIIQPVNDIAMTSIKISRGEYDRRINLDLMRGDLRELAISINGMLDIITDLIQTEEAQKELQRNIINLLDTVSRASDGDLSRRGEVTGDVLGSVADAFNLMLDSFSRLIIQAKYAGAKVIQASTAIMSAMRRIAMDAKRQGREIHQLTTMIQQISRSAQRASLSSDMANEEAQRASAAAKEGLKTADETTRRMQTIRNNVQSTTKTIKGLGDRSFEINAIVELINDISSRTNILSLNATIEASKAGEQGKGFAVVADEIRKLAERTQNATREVSSFIEDIQVETHDAVVAMEDVTREVELGWRQTEEATVHLREIEQVISNSAEKIKDISVASQAMVSSMDSMVDQINSIFQVAKKTTEEIYQTTQVANGLLGPLETLNSVIQHFRVLESVGLDDFSGEIAMQNTASIIPESNIDDIVSESDFSDSQDQEQQEEIKDLSGSVHSEPGKIYVQTFNNSLSGSGKDNEDSGDK